MEIERIAALLEVVSFFCVTLDLYGKERIITLGKKVHRITNYVKQIDIARFIWKNIRAFTDGEIQMEFSWKSWQYSLPYDDWFGVILALITLPIMFFVSPIVWGIVTKSPLLFDTPLANLIFQILLTFFILGFFIGVVVISFGIIVTILEFLIDGVLKFTLFLLDQMNMDGLLLVIGTILFLLSKLIVFVN